jgi:Mab-21 protein
MEQLICDFLCNTCRVHPNPSMHRFNALFYCIDFASIRVDDGDYSRMATSTGSASEFYIEPLLSCIGDYDIMHNENNVLAIQAGHQVPRCLPAEFHHRVIVYELIKTKFPCYVFLKRGGEMIKCNNDENYSYKPTADEVYVFGTELTDVSLAHGPAALNPHLCPAARSYSINDRDSSWMSIDSVYCIRCLLWPTQADEWTTRYRKYDWPDRATVDRVINNGCDVVQIAHPQYRQDESMRKRQWRISFSRAETVLLNSWSVQQQLVYHLLRIFMKTIKSKNNLDNSINNYHIKTLMLWVSELYPLEAWISNTLICMCNYLLHELATCLNDSFCPSFFATDCNLLENIENTHELQSFVSYLTNLTDDSLCVWLTDDYIRQYAEQCPHHISTLFLGNRTLQALPDALSRITDWRRSCLDEISCSDFGRVCMDLQQETFRFPSSTEISWLLCKYIIGQIHELDSRFLIYYYALILLKIASLLDRGQSALRLANVVLMFIQSGAPVSFLDDSTSDKRTNVMNTKPVSVSPKQPRSFIVCKHFQAASFLMQSSRLSYNKTPFVSRLYSELSKVFLLSALQCTRVECKDFHAASSCLSNVYLSCLYLSTKQYKYAFNQICNASSSSQIQCGPFSRVHRYVLPCFDETVETILGLALFYKFLLQTFASYRKQHRRCVDILSSDLFAFYLITFFSDVDCSQVIGKSRREMYDRCKTGLLRKRVLTVVDILLFHEMYQKTNVNGQCKLVSNSTSHECKEEHVSRVRSQQSCNVKTKRLSRLLVQCAVEHLTEFRESMSRDFSSMYHIITTDYRAMYAYKCRLYEQCYDLCENSAVHRTQAYDEYKAYVFLARESNLLNLVDDECSSMIGLAKLCGRWDNDPRSSECMFQLVLSLYLFIQSALKLRKPLATIIEILGCVIVVFRKLTYEFIINRALMIFVYRKAMKHFRSIINH